MITRKRGQLYETEEPTIQEYLTAIYEGRGPRFFQLKLVEHYDRKEKERLKIAKKKEKDEERNKKKKEGIGTDEIQEDSQEEDEWQRQYEILQQANEEEQYRDINHSEEEGENTEHTRELKEKVRKRRKEAQLKN